LTALFSPKANNAIKPVSYSHGSKHFQFAFLLGFGADAEPARAAKRTYSPGVASARPASRCVWRGGGLAKPHPPKVNARWTRRALMCQSQSHLSDFPLGPKLRPM
jgi:hypothetical protein